MRRRAGGRAVSKLLQVALGIIAAIGRYVDIGDLVFNTQAGAAFGYQLLWTLPVGVVGIMIFAEMSGRIAAVLPRGVQPASIGTTALAAIVPFGEVGLVLGLLGIMFAVGGATIDTGFSAAYDLAQYLGWDWGKRKGRLDAPRWTASWIAMSVLAYALVATGLDPVALTEYAVVLSAIAMPLTFLPVVKGAKRPGTDGRTRQRTDAAPGARRPLPAAAAAVAAPGPSADTRRSHAVAPGTGDATVNQTSGGVCR